MPLLAALLAALPAALPAVPGSASTARGRQRARSSACSKQMAHLETSFSVTTNDGGGEMHTTFAKG